MLRDICAALHGPWLEAAGAREAQARPVHYRAIVERAGGEFVHHDGGIEDNIGRLPALLGAADAVICLAGDCSHAAYRLAKRYCKAEGKLCALLAGSSVHAMSSCVERLPAVG